MKKPKTERIPVRASAKEKAALQAAAEAEGLSLSAWIIRTCLMALKGKK